MQFIVKVLKNHLKPFLYAIWEWKIYGTVQWMKWFHLSYRLIFIFILRVENLHFVALNIGENFKPRGEQKKQLSFDWWMVFVLCSVLNSAALPVEHWLSIRPLTKATHIEQEILHNFDR